MRKVLCAVFLAMLVYMVWSLASPQAEADHDMVFAPCDPEDTRSVDERVWYIDYQSGDMLRFDDPWWGERPGFGRYTNWRHQCRLGMTGVWQAAPILPLPHPPTHTIESRDAIRAAATTTAVPPTTTAPTVIATTTVAPAPTTTEAPITATTVPVTVTTTVPVVEELGDGYSLPDGYDLWDAEYDGWPFKKTILLLEQRYPANVPGKRYFPLSAAVRFLKQGGMVGGLDFLWNNG